MTSHTMTLEEMKAFVRRHDDEVINKRDLSGLETDYTPDCVDHNGPPGLEPGPAGARAFLTVLLNAFPDLQSTIEDVIAEGDKVVVRKSWTGTHEGEFMGATPTGARVNFEGIVIWRVEGSKLAERWSAIDRFGLIQQLGVLPPLTG